MQYQQEWRVWEAAPYEVYFERHPSWETGETVSYGAEEQANT